MHPVTEHATTAAAIRRPKSCINGTPRNGTPKNIPREYHKGHQPAPGDTVPTGRESSHLFGARRCFLPAAKRDCRESHRVGRNKTQQATDEHTVQEILAQRLWVGHATSPAPWRGQGSEWEARPERRRVWGALDGCASRLKMLRTREGETSTPSHSSGLAIRTRCQ